MVKQDDEMVNSPKDGCWTSTASNSTLLVFSSVLDLLHLLTLDLLSLFLLLLLLLLLFALLLGLLACEGRGGKEANTGKGIDASTAWRIEII